MNDKRTLTRQYKAARVPMGVFLIRNHANGRLYVDASMNLPGAMNRHRFELQLRSHRNKELQRDWIACGADQFSFEVLERLKERDDPQFDYPAELADALALWREELPCHGPAGYNGRPGPAHTKEAP
ncbi:GIY-YIG nuclease family protein [Variovorax terrae]|uniref:GIY-YIG nuclease family protein n=1 Tax=Variovorax terrae TaxID=2923278 RepID=A0A9X1VU92_9BURK|nr:GIY-YIG nuclease family protein [Variovorax terrae]MCJ0762149.1 GIY-YIG nuclease family protein [Variovorax terrae]